MTRGDVVRDERTLLVENASYRWGYLFLAYGLLAIAGFRGLVQREASWELLALVVLSGGVTALYQARKRVLSRRWAAVVLGAVILAAVLAALITFLR